jgi:hypothetical protein
MWVFHIYQHETLQNYWSFGHRVTEVQALRPGDPSGRVNHCNWLIQSMNDGILDPQIVFLSDKAWFHLHGHVNSQNNWYWSSMNPRFNQEIPLYDPKVGVWCVIIAKQITGPIFFLEKPSIHTDTLITFLISFPHTTDKMRLQQIPLKTH